MGIVRNLAEALGHLVCPSRGARPHKTGPGAIGVHNPHYMRQKNKREKIEEKKEKWSKRNLKKEKKKRGEKFIFYPQ